MSAAPLIISVQQRLRDAGYRDLATPFRMAGVEFQFTGAMLGSAGRGLDLILLFDTTTGDFGDRDASRIRARVEALSRALDITESRYVITSVLVGATLVDGIEALSDTCRVLQVENVALTSDVAIAGGAMLQQMEDQIRVLLPLTLPETTVEIAGGLAPAMDQLISALPKSVDTAMVTALIEAAQRGEEAVTQTAGLLIAAPLSDATDGAHS